MCKRDMQTVGLREGDEGDRAYWKGTIKTIAATPDDGKSQRKRRRSIKYGETSTEVNGHITIVSNVSFSGFFIIIYS